ncbi:MAG: sensor histidine kinase [Myxococcota bacterium]
MDPARPSPDCGSASPGDEASGSLVLVDRLALLGTLVASVAHEVSNPITYVVGNLGELERLCGALREAVTGYRQMAAELPASAQRIAQVEAKLVQVGGLDGMDEILGDALEGAGRIRDLCADLLALSRDARPDRWQPIDVHALIDWSLRLVRSRLEPIARVERLDGATRPALGDRTQLGQVVLNLLTNAVDACAIDAGANGGCGTGEPPGRIRIETQDREGGIEISIRDTGCGVPEKIRARLFDAFFTTKPEGEGNGLGLYISRRIVEQHGGRLEFLAAPGGGTTFRVFLPSRDSDEDSE